MADPTTYRPEAGGDPDRPGRLPVPRRARPGHLRRQGQVPAPAAVVLLPGHHRPAPAHGRRWSRPPRRSSGPSCAPRSRRSSSSTPGSRSSTRASTSSTATTSPTPSSPSPWARSSRGPRCMRGAKRKGTRYFGPYGHAWAIRETLDLLLRVFPVRTCSSGVFKRAAASGRPCLLGYIDKCSAPCVGRVTARGAPRHRRGLLRLHGRQHDALRQAARDPDDARRRPSSTSSRPPGCATTSAP